MGWPGPVKAHSGQLLQPEYSLVDMAKPCHHWENESIQKEAQLSTTDGGAARRGELRGGCERRIDMAGFLLDGGRG
jgi:hypothetical protein